MLHVTLNKMWFAGKTLEPFLTSQHLVQKSTCTYTYTYTQTPTHPPTQSIYVMDHIQHHWSQYQLNVSALKKMQIYRLHRFFIMLNPMHIFVWHSSPYTSRSTLPAYLTPSVNTFMTICSFKASLYALNTWFAWTYLFFNALNNFTAIAVHVQNK